MKAILMSIQPKWCELIARGEQKVKVCKTAPKEVPFKVYIYQTKVSKRVFLDHRFNTFFLGTSYFHDMGKVIGEFVCDRIDEYNTSCLDGEDRLKSLTCLDDVEIMDYMNNYINKKFYGLHISDLKIYDEPKELSEFRKPCVDKYEYCQGCKHGFITIPPDEEEYALYHGGYYEFFDTVCLNTVSRPPQSWCYVEEQK